MKVFHCDHCNQLVNFENTFCVQCQRTLAYMPERRDIDSLDPVPGAADTYRAPDGRDYKLCANYVTHNVCNWAVPAGGPHALCESCRLTRVIPDLSVPGNRERWAKLEAAKRRLIYTLRGLGCPVVSKADDPQGGLAFEFLADTAETVLTGHADGLITLNIAEADDDERERRRLAMNEPYRTVLGHFRHEVGHYYFDVLLKGSVRTDAFRRLFGDETQDYGEALKRHYAQGPPPNWQDSFVSAYATSHPWEDWAETWAHYLTMIDTLETASAWGVRLLPADAAMPRIKSVPEEPHAERFDTLIKSWFPLTFALNSLNRGFGVPDAYPFVLSPKAIEKLRFVHDMLSGADLVKLLPDPHPPKAPAARVLS